MFDLGPHAGFIWISYAAVLAGVVGLTLWVWTDESAQRRRLADLERRGMRRRSSQQEGTEKS
jgi:heme exporter protein D